MFQGLLLLAFYTFASRYLGLEEINYRKKRFEKGHKLTFLFFVLDLPASKHWRLFLFFVSPKTFNEMKKISSGLRKRWNFILY